MANTLRLGIFIVSTLFMAAVATFLIGERQFMFAKTYELRTRFKDVAGLIDGAEVRVGGIHKGIVKHIELPDAPNGDMTVTMSLDESTRKVLRADSVATIGSEGLLGSKYVDISFGSPKGAPIGQEATIASKPPVEVQDMIEKAGDALGDVRGQMAAVTTKAAEGAAAFTENMEAMRHNFFLKGFFNNRGYEDSSKLKDNLISQAPKGAPVQTFSYDVKKIFVDVDHAKMKNEKALNDAGNFLQTTPFSTAVVLAVSGLKGDSEELETMLQARAMVVRDYLVSNFRMDDKRVKTMIRGKSGAKTDDGTIEILVYGGKSPAAGQPHAGDPR
jgi:hypothetical protein